jgi:hypothetical protein
VYLPTKNGFSIPAVRATINSASVRGPAGAPTFLVPNKTPLLLNGPHFRPWPREAWGEAWRGGGKRLTNRDNGV